VAHDHFEIAVVVPDCDLAGLRRRRDQAVGELHAMMRSALVGDQAQTSNPRCQSVPVIAHCGRNHSRWRSRRNSSTVRADYRSSLTT